MVIAVPFKVEFDRADLSDREVQIVTLFAEALIVQDLSMVALVQSSHGLPSEITPERVRDAANTASRLIGLYLPGTNPRVVPRPPT